MAAPAQRPRLTFACELDSVRLAELFKDGTVIGELEALGARVAMMVSDLSAERAAVITRLNRAGIPVVGIPLLPAQDGDCFTVENLPRAASRYGEFKDWSRQHALTWERIGLDVEPEARFYEQIMSGGGRPRKVWLAEGLRLLLRAALRSSLNPRRAALGAVALGLGVRQLWISRR